MWLHPFEDHVIGRLDGGLPFPLQLRDGRIASARPWLAKPGWCFHPVDEDYQPVRLQGTAAPWRSAPTVRPERTVFVRDFHDRTAQAYVGNDGGHAWKFVADTAVGHLSGWVPSATEALRAVDTHLLREGYVLEGEVFAAPLMPGYRVHPQGTARSR